MVDYFFLEHWIAVAVSSQEIDVLCLDIERQPSQFNFFVRPSTPTPQRLKLSKHRGQQSKPNNAQSTPSLDPSSKQETNKQKFFFPKKEETQTNVDIWFAVSNNEPSEDPNALLTAKEKRKTQRKYSLYSLLPESPSNPPKQARLGIHRQISSRVLYNLSLFLSFSLFLFLFLSLFLSFSFSLCNVHWLENFIVKNIKCLSDLLHARNSTFDKKSSVLFM
jgi:hypothetical protein